MLKKLIDFAVSGVLGKWLGEAISQVISGSSPMSRESDDLFRKNLHFP